MAELKSLIHIESKGWSQFSGAGKSFAGIFRELFNGICFGIPVSQRTSVEVNNALDAVMSSGERMINERDSRDIVGTFMRVLVDIPDVEKVTNWKVVIKNCMSQIMAFGEKVDSEHSGLLDDVLFGRKAKGGLGITAPSGMGTRGSIPGQQLPAVNATGDNGNQNKGNTTGIDSWGNYSGVAGNYNKNGNSDGKGKGKGGKNGGKGGKGDKNDKDNASGNQNQGGYQNWQPRWSPTRDEATWNNTMSNAGYSKQTKGVTFDTTVDSSAQVNIEQATELTEMIPHRLKKHVICPNLFSCTGKADGTCSMTHALDATSRQWKWNFFRKGLPSGDFEKDKKELMREFVTFLEKKILNEPPKDFDKETGEWTG